MKKIFKKRLLKRLDTGLDKNLTEKEKEKSDSMVDNDIKTFLNKKKGWLSAEKVTIKCRKTFRNNFQTYIKDWLRLYFSLISNNKRKISRSI